MTLHELQSATWMAEDEDAGLSGRGIRERYARACWTIFTPALAPTRLAPAATIA